MNEWKTFVIMLFTFIVGVILIVWGGITAITSSPNIPEEVLEGALKLVKSGGSIVLVPIIYFLFNKINKN